jgi:hypothetical protein
MHRLHSFEPDNCFKPGLYFGADECRSPFVLSVVSRCRKDYRQPIKAVSDRSVFRIPLSGGGDMLEVAENEGVGVWPNWD